MADRTAITPPPTKSKSKPASGTPRGHRTGGDGYPLTYLRSDIAREMEKEMLTCSLDEFQKSYFNFNPSNEDVDKCAEILRAKGILTKKFKLSAKFIPAESKEKEDVAFRSVKIIAEQLSAYRFPEPNVEEGPLDEPHLEYQECPNDTVKSEILGGNFKIDGYFKLGLKSGLSTREKKVNAPDAAVIFEFKKGTIFNKDVLDNRKKIVSAASHIMNDDPRRAFMFGISMEGNMMSVWYFSRSHSTKSHAFDYTTEPKKLISVFLSLLFGNVTHLGYDPAVRRVGGSAIHYEYKVQCQGGPRYYKTIGPLSASRALCITGRVARVWKAQQISGFGGVVINSKPVALKDVWLDLEAQTERQIQEKLFKAIKSDSVETKQRLECLGGSLGDMIKGLITEDKYHEVFMTIDCDDENGMRTKKQPQSATTDRDLFNSHNADSEKSQSAQLRGAGPRTQSTPSVPTSSKHKSPHSSRISEERSYVQKKRYLVVYSDVGKALHHAGGFETVFKALLDGLYALALMFVANWVHRDVSTGNIIVFGEGSNARGRLSDLEYAKEVNPDSPSSSDPKTGTPFFMAYELLKGQRIRILDQKEPDYEETGGQYTPGQYNDWPIILKTPDAPDVFHNIQHDLESLWWIALWMLLTRVDHPDSKELATKLFTNHSNLEERGNFLRSATYFQRDVIEALHEDLHLFMVPLEFSRSRLCKTYQSRTDDFDATSYTPVFDQMFVTLAGCCDISISPKVKSVQFMPLPSIDAPHNHTSDPSQGSQGQKRPHNSEQPTMRRNRPRHHT